MASYVSFSQVLSSGLAVLVLLSALPASAQNLAIPPVVEHNEPIVVNGESFAILDSLAITIKRDQVEGSAIQYQKVSADGRYELIEILPAITKERKEAEAPTPRQLYRFAKVLDKETGKPIKVALPIRFEP